MMTTDPQVPILLPAQVSPPVETAAGPDALTTAGVPAAVDTVAEVSTLQAQEPPARLSNKTPK
jgi:hypothetical protein